MLDQTVPVCTPRMSVGKDAVVEANEARGRYWNQGRITQAQATTSGSHQQPVPEHNQYPSQATVEVLKTIRPSTRRSLTQSSKTPRKSLLMCWLSSSRTAEDDLITIDTCAFLETIFILEGGPGCGNRPGVIPLFSNFPLLTFLSL